MEQKAYDEMNAALYAEDGEMNTALYANDDEMNNTAFYTDTTVEQNCFTVTSARVSISNYTSFIIVRYSPAARDVIDEYPQGNRQGNENSPRKIAP